jgi:hypothetical protein
MISLLEAEIEETKDIAERERNDKQKESEENISQIRNAYEMEKETFDKRHRNEVTKLKRKLD